MPGRATRGQLSSTRWLRLAVAVLSLIVGLGVALPAFARLAAGPKAHACHCDTGSGHAHCDCSICFPELESDLAPINVALKGRCGDDDTGWRTFADPAIVPAGLIAVAPHEGELAPSPCPDPFHRRGDPPDPRPPRSSVP